MLELFVRKVAYRIDGPALLKEDGLDGSAAGKPEKPAKTPRGDVEKQLRQYVLI
jgi:hypothetical protein